MRASSEDSHPSAFYRHFGFLELDGQRLWRHITDIERALTG